MVDWLIVWGALEAAGVLVRPILEDLAKDSAKDYAKDFFKDCLKKVIRLPEPDVQKEAYGKALKEFLELVQQELETAGYQDIQIQQYVQPLKRFIANPQVAAILGQAFESDCRSLDTRSLAQTWKDLNLPYLPDEFDWDLVSKLYLRKVKAIVQKSDTLRPIFSAESQAATAESLQELVGIAPEFDLGRYAAGLQEQYGQKKLSNLSGDLLGRSGWGAAANCPQTGSSCDHDRPPARRRHQWDRSECGDRPGGSGKNRDDQQ
jgi:hypothetical protein